MHIARLLPAFATLAGLVTAYPTERALTTYAPPSSDPFYDVPSNLADLANGDIVRSRKVSTSLDAFARSTYQLAYRTTSALNEPAVTVTTVFAPLVPASPPRLLLVMAPTDSANVDCAPSWAMVSQTNGTLYNAATTAPDVVAALSKGWYVSLPDHLQEVAAFISGPTEAFAGIDGLRALLNHRETLPSATGYQAAIKGYSGGGHACAWTTQSLPAYGSELNVVGAACGGTVANLRATFDKLNKGPFVGLALSALAGLANSEPELDAWLSNALYPNGTAAIAYARTDASCVLPGLGSVNPYSNIDVYTMMKGGEAALDEEVPARYLKLGELGQPTTGEYGNNGVLSVPTFLYHSRSDEVVPWDPIPGYYASQCAQGAKITLSTTLISGHLTTYLAYIGQSIQFLEDRFNGVKLASCSRSDTILIPLFSPAYIKAVGLNAWNMILALGGKTFGQETILL
ncbi:hypothetical protein JCM10213_000023 [Rhodosporidiobolus nylandii]